MLMSVLASQLTQHSCLIFVGDGIDDDGIDDDDDDESKHMPIFQQKEI
jgi:hypothetical protein